MAPCSLPMTGWRPHATWKLDRALADWPAQEHVTVIGQVPLVVRPPTFHVQLTAPLEEATLSMSPAAVEGPEA